MIIPRVLKGFRDFLPDAESARRSLYNNFEDVFRSQGFLPIDTPAIEYSEILLGKSGGETEKQVYRWNDHGGRDVALRFDLTVPFARFIAEHRSELIMPFKRYHIAKVWRGENTQKGRYREFMQCDFDIVGASSACSDAEILLTAWYALASAGVKDITVRVNHRGIFNRFLAKIGIEDKHTDILRAVDKIEKTGRDTVKKYLTVLCGIDNAESILEYIEIRGTWDEKLSKMKDMAGGDSDDSRRLATIARFLNDAGRADYFTLDTSITRGLDYYTGIVFETTLNELPSIGSICSGGRYDNLTEIYSKDILSGAGGSIGLDRLISALESLAILPESSPAPICMIACVNENNFGFYARMAEKIRMAGISCELYLEEKKLSAQFICAEKKHIRFIIIPARENPDENSITLRETGSRTDCEFKDINAVLTRLRAI